MNHMKTIKSNAVSNNLSSAVWFELLFLSTIGLLSVIRRRFILSTAAAAAATMSPGMLAATGGSQKSFKGAGKRIAIAGVFEEVNTMPLRAWAMPLTGNGDRACDAKARRELASVGRHPLRHRQWHYRG